MPRHSRQSSAHRQIPTSPGFPTIRPLSLLADREAVVDRVLLDRHAPPQLERKHLGMATEDVAPAFLARKHLGMETEDVATAFPAIVGPPADPHQPRIAHHPPVQPLGEASLSTAPSPRVASTPITCGVPNLQGWGAWLGDIGYNERTKQETKLWILLNFILSNPNNQLTIGKNHKQEKVTFCNIGV